MKILVTGSAGFIGYHLCRRLLDESHDILGVDSINDYYDRNLKYSRLDELKSYQRFDFKKNDICDLDALSRIFKSFNPEMVVNLAAQPGVRYSLDNPYAYLNSNLVGFINIIELCKDFQVAGLIYASSSSVYGNNKKLPFSIDDKVVTPTSLYGATKSSNELIAYSYSNIYGLNTTGLRYFTVYGPYYRPDMAMFIFIKNIISRNPISVYNNGNMKRDFTFIDDIIDGTVSAIYNNYDYELFNLGNDKSEHLMDLINLIESNIGIKAKINYKPMQSGDMLETWADINHSKEKLKYNPKIDISNGVPKLIDWYREYYGV